MEIRSRVLTGQADRQTDTKWEHFWNVSVSKWTFFNDRTGNFKPL